MNIGLADVMRAAMNLTRDQKLVEATGVIQSALLNAASVPSEFPDGTIPSSLTIEGRAIDLTAEIIEPEALGETEAVARLDRSQEPMIGAWDARPLGEAFARFRHAELPRFGLEGLTVGRPRKALEIPEGARFLSRSFSCAAGSRNYKLYIPRRPRTVRRSLLVMLHGGMQDADDFATGTRMNGLADEHGFIVAYPSQSRAANSSLCWNWFSTEHQMRGRGEPAIIAGITSEIVAEYAVDAARVFVAGLSAGGAMAAVMGATYPDLYAAIGVRTALPVGDRSSLRVCGHARQ